MLFIYHFTDIQQDVEDLKIYTPIEFANMNFEDSDSKWNYEHSKQSKHFIVFWENEFGMDPNSGTIPSEMRVDFDDLLGKAETFYQLNVNTLGFGKKEGSTSYLNEYKMQIYLYYQEEWLATGAGYDNVIGALWVNPTTCQPTGSVIAHEIGHCFQYQIYCDQLKNSGIDQGNTGFRYGYPNSLGGNSFWEQCAQWQSFMAYPSEAYEPRELELWIMNSHRAFEHEWMRYQSYWLHFYLCEKFGEESISKIWRESNYPEDALETFLRIELSGNYEQFKKIMFDYASRMSTFDLPYLDDLINHPEELKRNWIGSYETIFYPSEDGFKRISYGDCPGIFGFNCIEIDINNMTKQITLEFRGLEQGDNLAIEDPGTYYIEESPAGNVQTFNVNVDVEWGWSYGFVALLKDGSRVYGDVIEGKNNVINYEIPDNIERLFFIVQGVPLEYLSHPWNETELDDVQFPYEIRYY